MFNEILIENLKSYEKETRIKLGKITVLIGKNNSGKSTILQAFVLLLQSLERQSSVFQTNSDIIDLGEYADVVNSNNENKFIKIGFSGREIIQIGGFFDPHLEEEYADYFFTVKANRSNLNEISFFVKSDHTQLEYNWNNNRESANLIRSFDNKRQIPVKTASMNGFIPNLTIDQGTSELNRKFNDDFQGNFLKNIVKKIVTVSIIEICNMVNDDSFLFVRFFRSKLIFII